MSEQNYFTNSESPCCPKCLPPSYGIAGHMVLEEMSVEEVQDDCHGGHPKGITLSIRNHPPFLMSCIKFQLHAKIVSFQYPWQPS